MTSSQSKAGIASISWYLFYYQNGGALIPHPRLNNTAAAASLEEAVEQLVPTCVFTGVFTFMMSYVKMHTGPPPTSRMTPAIAEDRQRNWCTAAAFSSLEAMP